MFVVRCEECNICQILRDGHYFISFILYWSDFSIFLFRLEMCNISSNILVYVSFCIQRRQKKDSSLAQILVVRRKHEQSNIFPQSTRYSVLLPSALGCVHDCLRHGNRRFLARFKVVTLTSFPLVCDKVSRRSFVRCDHFQVTFEYFSNLGPELEHKLFVKTSLF